MTKDDSRGWCWSWDGKDWQEESFPTREAAVEDARETAKLYPLPSPPKKIWLGRTTILDPEQHLDVVRDIDRKIMDDSVYYQNEWTNSEVFKCRFPVQAQTDFEVILSTWVAKWVSTTAFKVSDVERIEL